MAKEAVILTIGNEILTGEITDENSGWVAKRLFNLGIDLKFIVTIPDDLDFIADLVNDYRKKYDYIITLGGLGPTPDDVTKPAIAKALNLELIENLTVVDLIKNYHKNNKDEITKNTLSMAIFPENIELIYTSDKTWAIGMKIENIFSFPGSPSLLKDMFPTIEHYFEKSKIYKTKLTVNCSETTFSDIMLDIINEFKEVDIGSYPSEDFKVSKLIFRSRNIQKINECKETFFNRLSQRFPNLQIT